MDSTKISTLLYAFGSYFDKGTRTAIQENLRTIPDKYFTELSFTTLKKPVVALLLSFFFGLLGADRFYIGDIRLGIVKLITCGGLGFWAIADWFLIVGRTKEINREIFHSAIKSIEVREQ